MLEKLLGKKSLRKFARHIPTTGLALLAIAPAFGGCAGGELFQLGLTQEETTAAYFQLEQAKSDFRRYAESPSQETLDNALVAAHSAFEFLKQRNLHTVDTGETPEVKDIYGLIQKIWRININNEQNLGALLSIFDDESFRKDFILNYGTSQVEVGGYIRIKDGVPEFKAERTDVLDRYIAYWSEFRQGDFKNRNSLLDFMDSMLQQSRKFIGKSEYGEAKKYISKLRLFIDQLEALHKFVEDPVLAKEHYKRDKSLYKFLEGLEIGSAKKTLNKLQDALALVELQFKYGLTPLKGLATLNLVDDLIGHWHTHPYNSLTDKLAKGKPIPPSENDLVASIYAGHSFVFSFGAETLKIWNIRYKEPFLLRAYPITPSLKPSEIPELRQNLMPMPLLN